MIILIVNDAYTRWKIKTVKKKLKKYAKKCKKKVRILKENYNGSKYISSLVKT